MKFEGFVDHAQAIEREPADLAIRDLVAELLHEANDDLQIVTRFVQGRVFPAWDSTTLDIGPRLCYEAIARAAGTNVSAADVEARLADVGEIGAVAASYDFTEQRGLAAFSSDETPGRSVAEVQDRFERLASAAGDGSQDRKLDVLFGLFNGSTPDEARYLARLVLSEMRIGVGEGTVRDAIALAFDVPVADVERALQVSNDYGLVAEVARDEGSKGLEEITLEIGRPVQPMLAQAGTAADALDSWNEVAVEWKYDGARVQIHTDGESVEIFSRNMENVTAPLPEIVEFVEEHCSRPAILDGEVVAFGDDGDVLPFQAVLRRFRRKHDVARAREEIECRLVAFDCLHDDGTDLLDEPLTVRHQHLEAVLDDGVSVLWMTDDADSLASIEADALAAGHEGVMLKDPDSTYSAGRRGKHWLKRKPDVETLDLVVTGAEWGEGRRATYLGTFLLSVRTEGGTRSGGSRSSSERSPDGGYETIGKVATGISDEQLADLTELLDPHVRSQDGRTVEIEPAIVFEVGYEEIQRSPTYSSGYALRFPRFLAVRDDKAPSDADTLDRVERLAQR